MLLINIFNSYYNNNIIININNKYYNYMLINKIKTNSVIIVNLNKNVKIFLNNHLLNN